MNDEDRNKDSYPNAIFLVENGTRTRISPDVKAELKFSELAKMTDDEIIQYCKEHPYTAENSWKYDSQEEVDKKWWVPKQMNFTALTDGTGNNTAKERVNEEENEDGNTPLILSMESGDYTNHFTVYDSEYYGMNSMFTRSDKPVSFVMDQPGAEGVEFD